MVLHTAWVPHKEEVPRGRAEALLIVRMGFEGLSGRDEEHLAYCVRDD
jgi:hypothetical protein